MAVKSALKRLFVSDPQMDRHNNINFMRFVAASSVIYGHMAHLMGVPVPCLCGEEISTLAVKVFFVLSGYLIAQSFMRDGNPFRYLVRRVFRIFPGLIFVTLVTTFFLGPLVTVLSAQEYFSSPYTWRYLLNCLMNPQYYLPGVFADVPYPNAVNGSLWTLPVEFSMYLIMPLFLLLFRKFKFEKPGMICLALLTSVLSILNLTGHISVTGVVWGTALGSALVLVPYFCIGTIVALSPGIMRFFNVQVGFVLVLVMAAVQVGAYWKAELFVLALLPYCTFAFSVAAPAFFGRVFAEHDYSYGVYLWAFPIQQTLVFLLGPEAFGIMVYATIAFLCTVPCAMVSWFLVERPASKFGRRLTKWSRTRETARLEAKKASMAEEADHGQAA